MVKALVVRRSRTRPLAKSRRGWRVERAGEGLLPSCKIEKHFNRNTFFTSGVLGIGTEVVMCVSMMSVCSEHLENGFLKRGQNPLFSV